MWTANAFKRMGNMRRPMLLILLGHIMGAALPKWGQRPSPAGPFGEFVLCAAMVLGDRLLDGWFQIKPNQYVKCIFICTMLPMNLHLLLNEHFFCTSCPGEPLLWRLPTLRPCLITLLITRHCQGDQLPGLQTPGGLMLNAIGAAGPSPTWTTTHGSEQSGTSIAISAGQIGTNGSSSGGRNSGFASATGAAVLPWVVGQEPICRWFGTSGAHAGNEGAAVCMRLNL